MKLPPKMPQRAMVRIWVASLHQENACVEIHERFSFAQAANSRKRVDSNSIGRRHPSRRQKSPCGAFLDARLAQSTRAHQELQYPNRVLEFRNVYRDSCTCRNKVSRAWCSWMSKKLFVSENKSAPGCSSLEEELSGGCYWMHFIFAGAFSSGRCSRMFPAFCPGPDTHHGCRR